MHEPARRRVAVEGVLRDPGLLLVDPRRELEPATLPATAVAPAVRMTTPPPEPKLAERDWLDRWWLFFATLLVTNVASLHLGPGGFRTPSPTANVWISVLVLLAPRLRDSLRRNQRPGMRVAAKVGVALVSLFVTAFVACVAGAFLSIALVVALAVVLWIPVPHSFWPALLAVLAVVLFVDAWSPSRVPVSRVRFHRAVRALALVPVHGVLVFLLLHVFMSSRTWIGGADSMFQPVARIEDGRRSYVVVRSDPMAFTDPLLVVLEATPLVPGVLGWWRELGCIDDVYTAELRLDGDELCVDYVDRGRGRDSPQPMQRRFRVR